MTGFGRSRFFARFSARTLVQRRDIPSKSLFSHILRISPLFAIGCIRNDAYPDENKDFRERGEGYTLPNVPYHFGNI